MRIAMWSGPRNISTAMMRSWGNRPDTFVSDEPLYAHYLAVTGIDHPGAGEVIAQHETDWRTVVAELTGPIPDGRAIWYQKHMAHHLLPDVDRGWLNGMTNAFLVRDPGEMLTSLVKVLPEPTLPETGLPQQVEIFRHERERSGVTPPVLDARDVIESPRGILGAFCDRLGVPFDEAMLSWPPGPRATDGVWARHWYDAVEASTGFNAYRPRDDPMPGHLRPLCEACTDLYAELYKDRIVA